MSASPPGNMRGPRLKTPLLLLLLLLLSSLTGTVLCQSEDGDEIQEEEVPETDDSEVDDAAGTGDTDDLGPTEPPPDPPESTLSLDPTPTENSEIPDVENGSGNSHLNENTEEVSTETETTDVSEPPGSPEVEEQNLGLIIIPAVVVLVIVIIGMIVCGIFISRRWNSKAKDQELRKEDPYLDDTTAEKVPMPMFEEDVPSVLELEMEELDQWMKKDSETAEDSKNP